MFSVIYKDGGKYMDFTVLIQQLINGLTLGCVYALIALGYTMVYGIIKLINFAHGDIYMVGAFMGYYAGTSLGLKFIPALLFAMVVSAILGVIIEKVAYKPLRNSPKINLLITAIAISMLLQNIVRSPISFGPNHRPFPELITVRTLVSFWGIRITNIEGLLILVPIVLVCILQFIVHYTKIGKAMRAASFDKEAAQLMGINVNTVISFTFAIGSALAAAAGVLIAMKYPMIQPTMGIMPGLKAFVAAVLGGVGIIPGAMLGGLLMGIVEALIKGYGGSSYSDAIVFGLLIVILLFRPSGLLGKKVSEKV
jgi:branched-chain amino acid transport system permease protein